MLVRELDSACAAFHQCCCTILLIHVTPLTPAHVSYCRATNIDIMNLLLRKGTNFAATDARGSTAMHVAAFHGRIDSIAALVDAGTSVASKNSEGLVPMLLAPSSGPDPFSLFDRSAVKNAARGLESFGLDAGVEAHRVRLRLSPAAFTVAPTRHCALPAGHAPSVRYKVKESQRFIAPPPQTDGHSADCLEPKDLSAQVVEREGARSLNRRTRESEEHAIPERSATIAEMCHVMF